MGVVRLLIPLSCLLFLCNFQVDAPPLAAGVFKFANDGLDVECTVFTQGDRVGVEFRLNHPLQPDTDGYNLAVWSQSKDGDVRVFMYEPLGVSTRRHVRLISDEVAAVDETALKGFAGSVTTSEVDHWVCVVWFDPATIGGTLADTLGFRFSVMAGSSVTSHPEGLVGDEKLVPVDLKKVETRAPTDKHRAAVALDRETRVLAALAEADEARNRAKYIDTLTRAHQKDPTEIALLTPLIPIAPLPGSAHRNAATKEDLIAQEEIFSKLLALCPGWYAGHDFKLTLLMDAHKFEEAADYFEQWNTKLPDARLGAWNKYFSRGCRALGIARRWKVLQACMDRLNDQDFSESGLGAIKVAAEQALGAGQDEFATKLRDRLLKHHRDKHVVHAWWLEAMLESGRGADAMQIAKELLADPKLASQAQAAELFVLAAAMALDPPEAAEACTNAIEEFKLQGRARENLEEYAKACTNAAEGWQAELEFRHKDSEKQNPRVKVQTDQGDFVIELFEDDAPNTVANFVALVRDGFYSGRLIYRREPGWLIQGGGRDDSPSGSTEDWTIANEANQRRHWRGSIAMARTMDKDSGNTHFFITTGNRPMALELSTDWVVFGRITEGLEVAQRLHVGDRIQKAEAENLRDHDYQPVRLPAKKD